MFWGVGLLASQETENNKKKKKKEKITKKITKKIENYKLHLSNDLLLLLLLFLVGNLGEKLIRFLGVQQLRGSQNPKLNKLETTCTINIGRLKFKLHPPLSMS